MSKLSKKQMLSMAKKLGATDISKKQLDGKDQLGYEEVCLCYGSYGVNGGIWIKNGKYYYVDGRTPTLFALL